MKDVYQLIKLHKEVKMHILHYSLGLPPFRRGGMTKYCDDLMVEQKKMGNNVSLLYPGVLQNKSKECSLHFHKEFVLYGIELDDLIEIKNPLPVPLIDGVKDIDIIETAKNIDVFNSLFENNKIDILHIHTLMGLPFEVVSSARSHNVKVVFTSHDFFPVCPRAFLYHDGINCENDNGCIDCIKCNKNALSFRKMKFLQSKAYQIVKNSFIIKQLRGLHNIKMYSPKQKSINSMTHDTDPYSSQELALKYLKHRERNISLLNNIDLVHFNSNNTLQVFEKYGKNPQNSSVISITNNSISNHKKIKKVDGIIQFGYLGPALIHKGLELLLSACDDLWRNGNRFRLHIYVDEEVNREYLVNHRPYEHKDLHKVMEDFDVLVVPNICYETFGFTVLEAHSFGVPAIVSDRVGAKDLIYENENGAIFEPDKEVLASLLLNLINNPNIIEEYSRWITEHEVIKTMKDHAEELLQLYKSL